MTLEKVKVTDSRLPVLLKITEHGGNDMYRKDFLNQKWTDYNTLMYNVPKWSDTTFLNCVTSWDITG